MMRKPLSPTITLALFLIVTALVVPFSAETITLDQGFFTITNVTITPNQPGDGEVVIVSATIANSSPVENVTLYWSNESGIWNVVLMNAISGNVYEGKIPGHPADSTVNYYVLARSTTGQEARWPQTGSASYTVSNRRNPIHVKPNTNVSIPAGKHSLNVSDANAIIKLDLAFPMSINISLLVISNFTIGHVLHRVFSVGLDIKTNNSRAITSATISIQYDETLLDRYSISPDELRLYRREAGQNWAPYPSIIDPEIRSVSANTTSFSQWIVSDSEPYLELRVSSDKSIVGLDEEFSINTTLINLGGAALLNVSIAEFHVSGLVQTSGISSAILTILEGKSSASLIWNFTAQDVGIYTIIFVVSAGQNYSLSNSIEIEVVSSTSPPNNPSKQTMLSFSSGIFFVMIVLLGASWSYHKRLHKHESA